MYNEEDLESAIEAKVFNKEDVAAFRRHVAQRKGMPAVDEEHFRLVTGFNDIFVVIACMLLLASVAWIGSTLAPWMASVSITITAWALAEFFVRKRRMALPAIVLLLAFVGGAFTTGPMLLGQASESVILGSIIAAIAAWLHWRRFQVPITVAAGAAAVAGIAMATLFYAFPEAVTWAHLIAFIAGIVIFTLAIHWDARDTTRQTRKSDVAFWLHLLAAPLLVHPIFTSLDVFGGQTSLGQAIPVLALYVVIALISLLIDRRALMVSALGYVLYAFSSLLELYGLVSLSFAITALVIGIALLLLSAYWHPCRHFILNYVPEAVQKRLAPLR